MRLTFAAFALITLGLVGCGAETPQQPKSEAETEAVSASSSSAPAGEESVKGNSQTTIQVEFLGLPNDQVQLQGTIIGSDKAEFTLDVEGVTAGNEFEQTLTVAIAEDGSFSSEPLGSPNGLESGVYRASLRIESTSTSLDYSSSGSANVPLVGPKDLIQTGEGDDVSVFLEINFGVEGESAETVQAWQETQLRSYLTWHADLVRLHSAIAKGTTSNLKEWQMISEQHQKEFRSYGEKAEALESAMERRVIGGALEALNSMFVELESIREKEPQNSTSQLSSGDSLTPEYNIANQKFKNGLNELHRDMIQPIQTQRGL